MTNQKQKHNPSPKVKSTPGPWGCYVEEAGRDHLSARSAYVINSESENRYPKHYENQANAHLIAASPELLQNLKQVVACLEFAVNALEAPEKSSIREDLALAKQAIAKAEGGE